MHVLWSTDYQRMPWKNGGGETAEVAIWPPGAALDSFDWRVSMATVATDGPFSVFANIDRTLAVLTGTGLRLGVGDRDILELTPRSAPHTFRGEAKTTATLVSGPITDLNVMTRRGRFAQRVRRVEIVAPTVFAAAAWSTLIVCAVGHVRATSTTAALQIGALDTLAVAASDTPVSLAPEVPATIFIVELDKL